MFLCQIEEATALTLEKLGDEEADAMTMIGLQDRVCMNFKEVFDQIWKREWEARRGREEEAGIKRDVKGIKTT